MTTTLTSFDPLTGLSDRGSFIAQLKAMISECKQESRKFGLVCIDLDHFKWVNDSLGYDAGDNLLIQAAQRIQASVHQSREVARIGNDEFIVLVNNIHSVEDVTHAAEQIIEAFKHPIKVDNHELRVTLSVGITLFPDQGLVASDLMRNVETAMYQAKQNGRNLFVIYKPSANEGNDVRLLFKSQFEVALNKRQFFLEYQPRIELETGKIHSLEALVRWNHPIKGIVGPVDFITLSEETGFIVQLGEWVMREVCMQLKHWHQQGLSPVRVAVNISAKQITNSPFLYFVKDVLKKTGLDPSHLEIEITESTLMTAENHILITLEVLKELGIYISIDDFGIGYSSLNYLKHFPVDALKIDRSFIKDLPREKTLPKLIISLARKLKLQVIAEGVETYEQHAFLLKNGCQHAQGFLYSKPLPASEVEPLLTKSWVWTRSN